MARLTSEIEVKSWEVFQTNSTIMLTGYDNAGSDVVTVYATDKELVALRDVLIARYPVITEIRVAA